MFITPFSMRCDRPQFSIIRPKLMDMGYQFSQIGDFTSEPYLSNNLANNFGTVSNVTPDRKCDYQRTSFEIWDEKFFLALAVMNDNPNGEIGEWWKFIDDSEYFTKNKLYQQRCGDITDVGNFIDDSGDFNGFASNNKLRFRKATLEELITLYKKQYGNDTVFKKV